MGERSFPGFTGWDIAALYAEITSGLYIETRPGVDNLVKHCVPLIHVRAFTAGEEFHLPNTAMPAPSCADGLQVSQQEDRFSFGCSLIGQFA